LQSLYQNILATIGHTPVVKINHLAPANVNLYAKLEAFNPMGSVKDRLALAIIEDAEGKGLLKPGQRVRAALTARSGMRTIPQVFVAGRLIGGALDVMRAQKDGTLPKRLREVGVAFDQSASADPESFLPKWVQKRHDAA
jgi:glutaredoxin-related protein